MNLCALQRGHQNSLEMMPMFFMLMMLGGLKHPLICGGLGLVYTVTRFFYFKGYATGDPQKRLTIGKYGFLALLGLMVFTISFGATLLLWCFNYVPFLCFVLCFVCWELMLNNLWLLFSLLCVTLMLTQRNKWRKNLHVGL